VVIIVLPALSVHFRIGGGGDEIPRQNSLPGRALGGRSEGAD
jgi:hypothetical protein